MSQEGELLKKKTKDEKKAYDEQHGFNVMAVLSHLDGDSSVTDAFIKVLSFSLSADFCFGVYTIQYFSGYYRSTGSERSGGFDIGQQLIFFIY